MADLLLQMRGICKTFPGVKVLDRIDFDLRPGEVHALMGENGAGKSTLMKILIGIHQADEGSILVNGQPVQIADPRDAQDLGIAMIHQELNPVRDMQVFENIFLGREMRTRLGLADLAGMRDSAAALLTDLNIKVPATAYLRDLSVAQCQEVEIAKAISAHARILIMDEPTSAIADDDVDNLFTQIRSLRAKGVGIIYISHKMDEIFRICDRITVLRDGQLIGCNSVAALTEHTLIKMMVGRDVDEVFPERDTAIGDPVLEVENWSAPPKVGPVSFTVHRGEVLGIGGLVGAGRSELVESMFGLRPHSGRLVKDGKTLDVTSARHAIEAGIALVTEDRKQTGLNLEGSVSDNVTLPSLRRLFSSGLITGNVEAEVTDRYIRDLRIKTPSRSQLVVNLSGGNQQKVVLAKWLLTEPDVIIFDEPTRGIDVGAKQDIYKLIAHLADEGKAVVLISSEMPELIGLSDRILVLADGRHTGTLSRDDFSQEAIMGLASRYGE